MLDACAAPTWSPRSPLQPVRRYGVDAAILFSDIVVPLKAIGVDLDIKPGVGPVVAAPDPRRRGGLDRLRRARPRTTSPTSTEAVRHAGRRARRRRR